jgi:hypothetical protein
MTAQTIQLILKRKKNCISLWSAIQINPLTNNNKNLALTISLAANPGRLRTSRASEFSSTPQAVQLKW